MSLKPKINKTRAADRVEELTTEELKAAIADPNRAKKERTRLFLSQIL